MKSNITWFDIPVIDLDRAAKFYSSVLGREVEINNSGSIPIGMLPTPDGGSMGCLVKDNSGLPSSEGVMIWFDVEGRLYDAIDKTCEFGGKVIGEPHSINGFGYRAEIIDSEGNRIALYSNADK